MTGKTYFVIRVDGETERPDANGILSMLTNYDSKLADNLSVECIPVESDGFGHLVHYFDKAVSSTGEPVENI